MTKNEAKRLWREHVGRLKQYLDHHTLVLRAIRDARYDDARVEKQRTREAGARFARAAQQLNGYFDEP